ncbi:hypothetical protein ACFFLM_04540 [Deinococcus oregonensis]|uniref:Phage ABA sandwich domain-containing protein n=1 Tax=Deinococcus oregonensis TaxID=1805970 RepID=A0ABV6AUR1_9DEIO
MKTPPLNDTLAKLAHALPHRFTRFETDYDGSWWAVMQDDEPHGWVSMGDGNLNLSRLEYTLREVLEAEGFNWKVSRQGRNPDDTWQYWATVWHSRKCTQDLSCLADSPAHALALCVLDIW